MAEKATKPFSRGMGGTDDFIAEQFVPSDEYKAQQKALVQKLLASGLSLEQVAEMFLVPTDLLQQ
jgi:hypothetical protein